MRISEHNRDVFIRSIFASIAAHIDFLSSFFSFGLDQKWREKLISLSGLKTGEKVIDVCTGTGKLAFLLSKRVGPQGSVFGVDFCEEMLNIARKKIDSTVSNITFVSSDAKSLIFADNSFDVITVAFGMRNILDTYTALHEAHRVLKPGGRFFCLELTSPRKQWFNPIYNFYCFKVMPLIAKKIVKTDIPYNYLPRSIQAFPCANDFRSIIEKCGFSDVAIHSMTFGAATIFAARKN